MNWLFDKHRSFKPGKSIYLLSFKARMKRSQIVLSLVLFTVQIAQAQVPRLVKDIFIGPQESFPNSFTAAGDELYFEANDGIHGFELWKTRGDSAFLVRDIYPGASNSGISLMISFGDAVYFSAQDGVHGQELWKAIGDTAYMVKDLNPLGNSAPEEFFVHGSDLYFSAGDGLTGRELYRLHNDSIRRVQDINPGNLSSTPSRMTAVGSWLYFNAHIGNDTDELWMTDGDTVIKVKGIPYIRFSPPLGHTTLGNSLYFTSETGTTGRELWKAQGDTAFLIQDIYPGTGNSNLVHFTVLDNTLYFSANDGNSGQELWKLEADVLSLVHDAVAGAGSSSPYGLSVVGNDLYYVAGINSNDRKLYRVQGNTVAPVSVPGDLNQATIALNTVMGNRMFFIAGSASTGNELWVVEGNDVELVKDIRQGVDGSNPLNLTAVGDVLYFNADDGIHGKEAWTVLGDKAFLVKDIADGIPSGNALNFTSTGKALYFHAFDLDHGTELWKLDVPVYSQIDTSVCYGFQFGNRYLTQSGSYTDSLTTADNRDSFVYLNLIIPNVNVAIGRINSTLTAFTNNGQYQWVSCDHNFDTIGGATGKSFTPDSSGYYAVIINEQGCIDTSDCLEVNLLGIDLAKNLAVQVYPNPATKVLHIAFEGELSESYSLDLFDLNGRKVFSASQDQLESEIQTGHLARGIYTLRISTGTVTGYYKVVLR
ncbi:MAG: T9SS type A sorting domain-containing protein [Bacteroidetes bacterium]|nr:MAG: T9SS type A sorting domain-containing protein [Bacteroidota bacterium]